MRIFVAGAAGAIGRQLVPMLVEAGHDVAGTTRSDERARWLERVDATAVMVDAYDADAVRTVVLDARPEVVVHQLTDLALGFEPEEVAKTGRLREVGTRNLVEAAVAAGTRRLIAQSGAWLYADGPLPHDEGHPLRTPTSDPADNWGYVVADVALRSHVVRRAPPSSLPFPELGFVLPVPSSGGRRADALAGERAPSGRQSRSVAVPRLQT